MFRRLNPFLGTAQLGKSFEEKLLAHDAKEWQGSSQAVRLGELLGGKDRKADQQAWINFLDKEDEKTGGYQYRRRIRAVINAEDEPDEKKRDAQKTSNIMQLLKSGLSLQLIGLLLNENYTAFSAAALARDLSVPATVTRTAIEDRIEYLQASGDPEDFSVKKAAEETLIAWSRVDYLTAEEKQQLAARIVERRLYGNAVQAIFTAVGEKIASHRAPFTQASEQTLDFLLSQVDRVVADPQQDLNQALNLLNGIRDALRQKTADPVVPDGIMAQPPLTSVKQHNNNQINRLRDRVLSHAARLLGEPGRSMSVAEFLTVAYGSADVPLDKKPVANQIFNELKGHFDRTAVNNPPLPGELQELKAAFVRLQAATTKVLNMQVESKLLVESPASDQENALYHSVRARLPQLLDAGVSLAEIENLLNRKAQSGVVVEYKEVLNSFKEKLDNILNRPEADVPEQKAAQRQVADREFEELARYIQRFEQSDEAAVRAVATQFHVYLRGTVPLVVGPVQRGRQRIELRLQKLFENGVRPASLGLLDQRFITPRGQLELLLNRNYSDGFFSNIMQSIPANQRYLLVVELLRQVAEEDPEVKNSYERLMRLPADLRANQIIRAVQADPAYLAAGHEAENQAIGRFLTRYRNDDQRLNRCQALARRLNAILPAAQLVEEKKEEHKIDHRELVGVEREQQVHEERAQLLSRSAELLKKTRQFVQLNRVYQPARELLDIQEIESKPILDAWREAVRTEAKAKQAVNRAVAELNVAEDAVTPLVLAPAERIALGQAVQEAKIRLQQAQEAHELAQQRTAEAKKELDQQSSRELLVALDKALAMGTNSVNAQQNIRYVERHKPRLREDAASLLLQLDGQIGACELKLAALNNKRGFFTSELSARKKELTTTLGELQAARQEVSRCAELFEPPKNTTHPYPDYFDCFQSEYARLKNLNAQESMALDTAYVYDHQERNRPAAPIIGERRDEHMQRRMLARNGRDLLPPDGTVEAQVTYNTQPLRPFAQKTAELSIRVGKTAQDALAAEFNGELPDVGARRDKERLSIAMQLLDTYSQQLLKQNDAKIKQGQRAEVLARPLYLPNCSEPKAREMQLCLVALMDSLGVPHTYVNTIGCDQNRLYTAIQELRRESPEFGAAFDKLSQRYYVDQSHERELPPNLWSPRR